MIIQRGDDPGPFTKHRHYLPFLRELFRRRCAYCLTPDDKSGGEEGMQVDHFIPESRQPELRLAWHNLYYCCSACNLRKSNYPSPAEIERGCRFIDPCNDDPIHFFCLTQDNVTGDYCVVTALSPVADYEISRLQFNRRKDLRDFWRELNAQERDWMRRRSQIVSILSNGREDDDDAISLLKDCEIQITTILERWPFAKRPDEAN